MGFHFEGCGAYFDGLVCWPQTIAGLTAQVIHVHLMMMITKKKTLDDILNNSDNYITISFLKWSVDLTSNPQ